VVKFLDRSILDTSTVEAVSRELLAMLNSRGVTRIVLDVHRVRFMSSQMIGTLIAMHKKSIEIGGKVVLCEVKPELDRVFRTTRLNKVLLFERTKDRALKKLGVSA
jgi:anti-anti-sigma factor